MFPKFEVCNTTRSTITEVPFFRYSGSPYSVELKDFFWGGVCVGEGLRFSQGIKIIPSE